VKNYISSIKDFFLILHAILSIARDLVIDRIFLIYNKNHGLKSLLSLKKYKNSDTLFIFGTGSSLLDLSLEQLNEVRVHDSLGLNFFCLFDFVPTYYTLELSNSKLKNSNIKKNFKALGARSKDYQQTPIILRDLKMFDLLNGRYKDILPPKLINNFYCVGRMNISGRTKKVFAFSLKLISLLKLNLLSCSLLSKRASIICAISFAHKLGYKKVVLLGVDLNNTDYFYSVDPKYAKNKALLPSQLQSGDIHATYDSKVSFATIPYVLKELNRLILIKDGVKIFVGSKKSALYPEVSFWNWSSFNK